MKKWTPESDAMAMQGGTRRSGLTDKRKLTEMETEGVLVLSKRLMRGGMRTNEIGMV